MSINIIVEGIRDKQKLAALLTNEIQIFCTYGTPSTETLEQLAETIDEEVYIFTDNDDSGKRIRGKLREYFPDATHLYTRKEYGGVEKTPSEYLLAQLEKAGLAEHIVPVQTNPALWTKDEFN